MAIRRYGNGRRSRLKPDSIKRIGDFWREIIGIVIGVIVGSFISFIADGLSQTDYYDVAVFLVPFVCAAILAYSAYLFRASRHVSDQCNQRLTAMMDKMTASQLVIMRQDITLIVKDGYTEERITVEILNRTGSVYRTYRFGEYADAPFEGGRWIEIWRDGAQIQDLTLEDMNYHEAERQSTSGRKYVMPYEYDIYIPLNLRPNESCTLEVVKRRSNSFCNLFKESFNALVTPFLLNFPSGISCPGWNTGTNFVVKIILSLKGLTAFPTRVSFV